MTTGSKRAHNTRLGVPTDMGSLLGTSGCEGQSHKLIARKSTVAARDGVRKWWSLFSKSIKSKQKKSPFQAIYVSSLSLELAICIGTNLDDEQTLLITILADFEPNSWAQ